MTRSRKSYGVKECVICGKEFVPQNDEQVACGFACANEVRIRSFESKRIAEKAKKLTTHYVAWVYHRQMEMRENGVTVAVWRLEYRKANQIPEEENKENENDTK